MSHAITPIYEVVWTTLIRPIGDQFRCGLCNRYNDAYPLELAGRVSENIFKWTMDRINGILQEHFPSNFTCWCNVAGEMHCTSYNTSMQTINLLHRVMLHENEMMYDELGINWRMQTMTNYALGRNEIFICIDMIEPLPISMY